MKKKFILTTLAVVALAIGVVGMSAFEAHIINVTAHIENALAVNTTPISFGTVFPQEYFVDKTFTVGLSDSFLTAPRVDDVNYVIKQKPKCKANNPENPVQYAPVNYATHECPEGYTQMQSLCEYLSKGPDQSPANDTGERSYFQGDRCIQPTPQDGAIGRLAKSEQDLLDTWTVDLKVPPFNNYVGQDWPAGCPVLQGDPEGIDLGCDLWVEVTGISEQPTEETTLTVTKILTNDNGGDAIVSDFTLSIAGIGNVTSGVANAVTPGSYDVNEIGPSGYEATFTGDCDADGDVTIAAGQNLTCTITNNDIAPNITLIKSVINDDEGTALPADFNMTVNGTGVPSGTSIVVDANFANIINEDAEPGYTFVSITGNPECPAVLGGTATLDEGEAITCTITNDDDDET